MIVADTNILCSFAAGESLSALLKAMSTPCLCLPPAVQAELQAGFRANVAHLASLPPLMAVGALRIVELTPDQQARA